MTCTRRQELPASCKQASKWKERDREERRSAKDPVKIAILASAYMHLLTSLSAASLTLLPPSLSHCLAASLLSSRSLTHSLARSFQLLFITITCINSFKRCCECLMCAESRVRELCMCVCACVCELNVGSHIRHVCGASPALACTSSPAAAAAAVESSSCFLSRSPHACSVAAVCSCFSGDPR